MSYDPQQSILAHILLKDPFFPPEESIFSALERSASGLPEIGERQREGKALTFTIGGNVGTIAHTPAPFPPEALEGPCEMAWHWPGAADEVAKHEHFATVSIAGDEGHIVERHTLLSLLVRAILENTGAVGVLWGHSAALQREEAFMQMSKDISHEQLPLMLWINFVIYTDETGAISLATKGLNVFDGAELEIRGSRQEPEFILDAAYSVAHHAIERGAPLPDGSKVGSSESQSYSLRHVPSIWDDAETSMLLDL